MGGAAYQWVILTPDGEFRLERRMFDMPIPPKLGPIERMVVFCATNAVKRCDSTALAGAIELCGEGEVHGLYSGHISPFEPSVSHAVAEELADALEGEIRMGRVLIEEIVWRKIRPSGVPGPTGPSPQPTGSPGETLGWFEVQVVDEVGQPVAGVELEFSLAGRTEKRTADGSGKARVENVPESFASVKLSNVEAVKKKLVPIWEGQMGTRQGQAPEGPEVVREILRDAIPSVSLVSKIPRIIVLTPYVGRLRLIGTHFEGSKSFLMPSAFQGLAKLRELFAQHPKASLYIIGHTEPYPQLLEAEQLSQERAATVKAFLTDDVDAWMAWYDPSVSQEKRWGDNEDRHMLSTVAQPNGAAFFSPTIKHNVSTNTRASLKEFQQLNGSQQQDGTMDSATRRMLIAAYMKKDRGNDATYQSIKPLRIDPFGFGDQYALPPVENETPEQAKARGIDSRRVELYLFEPATPPIGTYKQWRDYFSESYDFRTDTSQRIYRVRLHDAEPRPASNVPFRLSIAGAPAIEDISITGWIEFITPSNQCSEVHLEWGALQNRKYAFARNICVDCNPTEPQESPASLNQRTARERLHNLGYCCETEEAFLLATMLFQLHQGISEMGLTQSKKLPPLTAARLLDVYSTGCDASTKTPT